VHYNASSSDAGGPKFYKPPQYSKDDEESDTAEVYPSDLEEDIEEPVFQSDFLLVQLPGVFLWLCIVSVAMPSSRPPHMNS